MENSDPINHRLNYDSFREGFTRQQTELHDCEDVEANPDGSKVPVHSYFNLEEEKTMWYYNFSEIMKLKSVQDTAGSQITAVADKKYTFLLNNDAHIIYKSQIEQTLPSI